MAGVIRLDDHRPKAEEPRVMLAQLTVYDNGDGTCWLADSLEHKEQFNWLLMKVAEISAHIVREKAERTGEM